MSQTNTATEVVDDNRCCAADTNTAGLIALPPTLVEAFATY